jgi:hypothetical protein
MKKVILLVVLIPQMLFAQKSFISEKIKPLVNFIEQNHTSPVDYVMNLFEKYDIVVIGERSHLDMTQYDLINQILSDSRFIAKVGHVFTEVGCYNMTDELNTVLKGTYPNDTIFDKELVQVIFNMDFMPVWEKTNYTKLMKDVYLVNKNLPAEKKISVTPTEMPFSWEQAKTITAEEFATTVHKMWKHKDLIMSNNAINELYKIFNGNDSRKKALIIYNMPHSCRYFANRQNTPFFACQIIADRFPGKVANVALNWTAISNDGETILLSNGGKLDAAFAACHNKSIGFDLANSPFGDCIFDFGEPMATSDVKMKDVYHGFIFYKPVLDWDNSVGVPNLDKIDCKDELARRSQIFGNRSNVDKEDEFMYYSKVRNFPMSLFFDEKQFNEQISKYYKP